MRNGRSRQKIEKGNFEIKRYSNEPLFLRTTKRGSASVPVPRFLVGGLLYFTHVSLPLLFYKTPVSPTRIFIYPLGIESIHLPGECRCVRYRGSETKCIRSPFGDGPESWILRADLKRGGNSPWPFTMLL